MALAVSDRTGRKSPTRFSELVQWVPLIYLIYLIYLIRRVLLSVAARCFWRYAGRQQVS